MRTHDFLKRRARPGCAEQKKELIAEHRMLCSLIDHHIIMCYDREDSHELIQAKKDRDAIEKLLMEITK